MGVPLAAPLSQLFLEPPSLTNSCPGLKIKLLRSPSLVPKWRNWQTR